MGTPLIALVPGALTIFLAFSGGGYFPPAVGVACAFLATGLVLRLTLTEQPLEGLGLPAALGAVALALLAVWMLVSSAWSDAPGRAVLEFNRALLYLLAFTLVATLPRTTGAARLLLGGLVAAATIVCVAGLLTRVLPAVFSVDMPVLPQRLSYPVTYWNGLGLLAALGLVGATHFACSVREHVAVRVAASAALPLLAATLYFTFSRASIAVAIVAVLGYMLVARPRGLGTGLLAALPPTLVAIKLSYDADLLAARDPTTAAAVEQGRELALALAACVAAAAVARLLLVRLGADRRLERIEVPPRTRRLAVGALATVVLAGVVGSVLAFDLGDRVSQQYERFKEGDTLEASADARERLTDVSNNGRLDHWDVALEAWRADRLKGTGAGTYELSWAQNRPSEFTVRDGHSLYLEMLSELGLVGTGLLALALVAMAVALVLRVRGPDRALWGALLVWVVAWAVHAAQDWVWELPSVTLGAVALGALALAEPAGTLRMPRIGRVVAGLLVLVLAVTPVLAGVSHSRLQASVAAFKDGDCTEAIDHALAASSALSVSAEPHAILGFCDVRLGKLDLAQQMMRNAIERDPGNWAWHYGLGLVQAAAGEDPLPAVAEARRLNPLEPRAREAEEAFADAAGPRQWRRRAEQARLPIN